MEKRHTTGLPLTMAPKVFCFSIKKIEKILENQQEKREKRSIGRIKEKERLSITKGINNFTISGKILA
jgi:hypothetical protein